MVKNAGPVVASFGVPELSGLYWAGRGLRAAAPWLDEAGANVAAWAGKYNKYMKYFRPNEYKVYKTWKGVPRGKPYPIPGGTRNRLAGMTLRSGRRKPLWNMQQYARDEGLMRFNARNALRATHEENMARWMAENPRPNRGRWALDKGKSVASGVKPRK